MKIGIYSLGLIGGSLLKALMGEDIRAVSQNEDTLKYLCQKGINCSSDINILRECDIVFVCSSIQHTPSVLKSLDSILSADTIVADVCSLKSVVMKDSHPYKFVGSHPMAGTENSGFSASFKELFQGAKWVLTPADNVSQCDIDKLVNVIEKTGAKVIFMSAEEHDRAAALISHMPMLLSQALMKSALTNECSLILAASGFRDMTRLAMSNETMACDMIKYNRYNISEALKLLNDAVNDLLDGDYKAQISELSKKRRFLYNSDGKNSYN